ncbi:MAG: DUF5682 family protein [Micrococcales bacterium]|nr:DUF5682 family protein [Micrococcales bacterium]
MISAAQVRALADRLVTDELVVVGVRHHSPACARVVERVFAERTPSVVLVEGPRSFDPLVPLLVHPEAQMPLAVYSYAHGRVTVPRDQAEPAGTDRSGQPDEDDDGADDPTATDVYLRLSAYYPFADYSPELVALRLAAEHGVPARFCDLDLAEHGQVERDGVSLGRSLLDERHYARSQRLADLAAQMGCRDAEDLWELLFEASDQPLDPTEHAARVCAYAAPSREDHDRAELDEEGTTAREAEMASHVRAALDARQPGDGPVLVVLGAFHALVLPDLLDDPPPRPDAPRTDLSRLTTGHALIRYGFDRMDRLHGYGSGMTSPGWYQRLWTTSHGAHGEPPRVSVLVDTLMDIVVALRKADHEVPMPATASALEHALRLAGLRDHDGPLRCDLVDAIIATMVRGDLDGEGARVLSVAHQVLTGDAVGAVPPGAGRPPLVDDAMDRAREARLNVDATKATSVGLDLYRRAVHRQTSRLLHGLALLGAPLGTRTRGPDFVHGTRLRQVQERWRYAWTPEVEAGLVEAAVYGSTVPEAVAAKFDEVLAQAGSDADQATQGLATALVLGLHGHAVAVVPWVRQALGKEPVFTAIVGAAARLAMLTESREPLEAQRVEGLDDLLAAAYLRAVYLGHQALTGEPPQLVAALVRLRELLVSQAGTALDADLFWPVVVTAADGHAQAQVRGGAWGMVFSAGRCDEQTLGQALHGTLAGGSAWAVEFVVGLLSTARETTWQTPAVLDVLDGFLRSWPDEEFFEYLPSLRLAFSELTPRETDQVAAQVAARYGMATLGPLLRRDTSASQVQANHALSLVVRALLERDRLAWWLDGAAPPDSVPGGPAPDQDAPPGAPSQDRADMVVALDRWRLVLGRYSERCLGSLGPGAVRMGAALDDLYERAYAGRGIRPGDGGGDGDAGERGADLSASAPHLVQWLNDVRELFPRRTVEILEKHALERFGLTALVTDPEALERMEPNEDLLRMVLTLKGMMNPAALAVARRIVAKVIDELMRRLRAQIRPALTGRMNRAEHSPVVVAANFDPHGTIRANLKHARWAGGQDSGDGSCVLGTPADGRRPQDTRTVPTVLATRAERRRQLVIERALFFERRSPKVPWDVIVCVDQSGSMVDSVIHSAVTAAILAGLPSFRLRLVAFDTSVVDLTKHVSDPLEVLMTVQLGGGTDIAQAVKYCSTLVENPHRTVFVLVTDFCEGGSVDDLVREVTRMAEARITLIGLAALEPDADPSYDRRTAQMCTDAGMPVAALTPSDLASWLVKVTS